MKLRLFKLVVFLLLGAIVNVAVAWAIVLWTPQEPTVPGMAVLPKPIPWPRPVPTDWPAPQRQTSGETWGLSQLLTQALVQPLDAPRSPGAVSGWGMSLFQAGWPCRCVEAQVAEVKRMGVPVRTDFRPAVKLPETLHFLRVREARYRVLPLRPIWLGFAINTLFYAAILWMLWLSPFVVRRVVRRKRGRCINCGYDLRGTSEGGGGCPECGWRWREQVET